MLKNKLLNYLHHSITISLIKFKNQIKNDIPGLVGSLIFFVLLSSYVILLYKAYGFTVFDLGVAYRTEYIFISTHTFVNWPIPHGLVTAMPYAKLIYIPLSLTLLIYNSPVTVLVTQTLIIAFGGFAIYKIFKKIINNLNLSILMQLVYFLYIPTYGYLTHGGNFMVYFEPFFLISYMYYIEKKYSRSFIFAGFASITNQWAPIIILLFYTLQIILDLKLFQKFLIKKYRNINFMNYIIRGIKVNSKEKYFFIILFLFSIIIFLISIEKYSLIGLIESSRINVANWYYLKSSSGIISIFGQMIDIKMEFLSQTIFPFLGIPLLTPYVILIVPYLVLSWYSNSPSYYYLLQQYPYLFVGFLFIGLAYYFNKLKNKKIIKKLIKVIFILTLVEFLIFSPFNILDIENGSFQSSIHENTIEKQLDYGLSLIPRNSIVFQNEFPQLMDCKKIYMNQNYNNESVDFAIITPRGYNSISEAFIGFNSYWANFFAHNSSYGIYESIQGIVIYKRNYTGPPIYYVPEILVSNINSTTKYGQPLPYNQYPGSFPWWTLSPGVYNLSFVIKANSTKDLPPQILIRIFVYYNNTPTIYITVVSLSQYKYYNGLYYVNCSYYSQGFYGFHIQAYSTTNVSQGNFTFQYFVASQTSVLISRNFNNNFIN